MHHADAGANRPTSNYIYDRLYRPKNHSSRDINNVYTNKKKRHRGDDDDDCVKKLLGITDFHMQSSPLFQVGQTRGATEKFELVDK